MEMVYYRDKTLKIIQKIPTNVALAFIISFKFFIKAGTVKYKINLIWIEKIKDLIIKLEVD